MAMRGDPSIPEKTRDRVKKIADELGYRRNARVSELMALLKQQSLSNGQEVLAYVLPVRKTDPGLAHYIRTSISHAKKRADERGYGLELFEMEEKGITAQRLGQIIEARGIRAALFGPHHEITGAIPLKADKLAMVALGYSVVEPAMHRVVIDHYRNVHLAMSQLVARGYRRIGLMLENETDARARDLITSGYWDVGRRFAKSLRLEAYVGLPDKAAIKRWKNKTKPDAIIGYDRVWYDLLQDIEPFDAESLGYAFLNHFEGDDIKAAGVPYMNGMLTEVAVDQLVAALQVNEFGVPAFPRTTSVPCAWQEGETVRELRESLQDPLFLLPSTVNAP